MGLSASKQENQEKIVNNKNLNKELNKIDKVKIKYNINESNKIRLFGDQFIKRYKNIFQFKFINSGN